MDGQLSHDAFRVAGLETAADIAEAWAADAAARHRGDDQEPVTQKMHAYQKDPHWGNVCVVCGEEESEPRHGAA